MPVIDLKPERLKCARAVLRCPYTIQCRSLGRVSMKCACIEDYHYVPLTVEKAREIQIFAEKAMQKLQPHIEVCPFHPHTNMATVLHIFVACPHYDPMGGGRCEITGNPPEAPVCIFAITFTITGVGKIPLVERIEDRAKVAKEHTEWMLDKTKSITHVLSQCPYFLRTEGADGQS